MTLKDKRDYIVKEIEKNHDITNIRDFITKLDSSGNIVKLYNTNPRLYIYDKNFLTSELILVINLLYKLIKANENK